MGHDVGDVYLNLENEPTLHSPLHDPASAMQTELDIIMLQSSEDELMADSCSDGSVI